MSTVTVVEVHWKKKKKKKTERDELHTIMFEPGGILAGVVGARALGGAYAIQHSSVKLSQAECVSRFPLGLGVLVFFFFLLRESSFSGE